MGHAAHNALDLTNQKFSKLTAIKYLRTNNNQKRIWLCQCECGNTTEVIASQLTSGKTKSCGCLFNESRKKLKKDLTGNRFGRLIVLEDTNKRNDLGVIYKCQCDCGTIKEIPGTYLIQEFTKSCGCLRKEQYIEHMANKKNTLIIRGIKITKELRLQINNFLEAQRKIRSKHCSICNSKQRINLHHIWGVNNKPELALDPDNIIELCNKCHKEFHQAYGYGMNTPSQLIEFYENFI